MVHPVLASFKKKIKICYLSTRLPAGGKFFYLEFNCQAGQRRGGLRPTRLNKGRGLINNLYLTLSQGGGLWFFFVLTLKRFTIERPNLFIFVNFIVVNKFSKTILLDAWVGGWSNDWTVFLAFLVIKLQSYWSKVHLFEKPMDVITSVTI